MKKNVLEKFGLAFIITFGLVFMLFIFGPSEIYFSNASEFEFVYGEFIWILVMISIAMSLLTAAILTILPQKLNNLLVSVEFGIMVAGYLQVMFFNESLDLLGVTPDGYQVDIKKQIINAVIWGIIILAIVIVAYLKNDIWKKVVSYVSVFLLCIQAVALLTLCVTAGEEAYQYTQDDYHLSGENQYVVSADKNVIVIILDFYSNQYLPAMEAKYPGATEFLHDFTYYNNMDSTYYGTFPSLAHMLTGQMLQADMPIDEWFVKIWDNETTSNFYKEAHQNNYVTNIYTPNDKFLCGNNDRAMLDGVVSNMVNSAQEIEVSHKLLIKTMLKMSGYRMFPEYVKSFFYTDMNEYADIVTIKENGIKHNNYDFYEGLLENGLSVDENSNYYIVQHLMGPHTLDTGADGHKKENATLEETAKGCLVIVEEYINQLKSLGVYDDSTIIITTDHGGKHDSQGIYFIKQPGEHHEEMLVTNAPASHREFLPTIAKAIGLDATKYGQTIYDFKQDELRERTVWVREFDPKYPAVPCYTSKKDGDANVLYGYKYTGAFQDLLNSIYGGPDIVEMLVDSYY